MNNQNNEIDPSILIEQIQSQEEQQQGNSFINSINPDPVDVVELVSGLGKSVLDLASSIADSINIDL